jgi:hypothetical protein
MAKFRDQAPTNLSLSLDPLKVYETYRMLLEMKLEPMDSCKATYSLCKHYNNYSSGAG